MNGPVQIQLATAADAHAIATVQVESWRVAYVDQIPADYLASLSIEQRYDIWRQGLEHPRQDRRTLVARIDDTVIGFISVARAADAEFDAETTGEVAALYIDPDRWRSGVGSALLQGGREWMIIRGFQRAILWVLEANSRARAFYERDGWRTDGTRIVDQDRGFPMAMVRYVVDLGTVDDRR